MSLSVLISTFDILAQSQQKISKVYTAKVYDSNKNKISGILYSVEDSSITLCVDSAFVKNNPLNDSLEIITISYRDIRKIKLIRNGAMEKGFLIGALAGGIPSFMLGAAADKAFQGVEYIVTLGTVDPKPSGIGPVFALVGFTIGGLIGLAAGSSSRNQIFIYNSLDRFNIEKDGLKQHSLIHNIQDSSEIVQYWEPKYFD